MSLFFLSQGDAEQENKAVNNKNNNSTPPSTSPTSTQKQTSPGKKVARQVSTVSQNSHSTLGEHHYSKTFTPKIERTS